MGSSHVQPAGAARGTSMRARLRAATSELHARVEDHLELLQPSLALDRYEATLRRLYGYYVPIEALLAGAVDGAVPLGVPLARRAPLLARDLLALGLGRHALEALPRCVDLPRIATRAEVAGCLYVLEGASLGGQVIARAVRRNLAIVPGSGADFFVGAGPRATRERWRAVVAWIEAVAAASGRADSIVAAACETFETLARWLEPGRRGAS